ncbi:MAG: WGR domain-containing protein [Sulfuricurvum sp.]|nr:WGR domain-containing protein [Sulfuricurvum sp.]
MTRSVKGRGRYYTLELIPNLFGEWLLIRSFGSLNRSTPMRMISEVFRDKSAAMKAYDELRNRKQKRGYEVSMG